MNFFQMLPAPKFGVLFLVFLSARLCSDIFDVNLHTIIRVCEHQTTLGLVLIGFLFQFGLNMEPAYGPLAGLLACAIG